MNYDLEGRTKDFSIDVLKLAMTIKRIPINQNIIDQLLRSSTSVGANYCEANNASSKKDFQNKISLCRKEIQETKYWLDLLYETEQVKLNEIKDLQQEAHELTLIFNKISSTLRNNKSIDN